VGSVATFKEQTLLTGDCDISVWHPDSKTINHCQPQSSRGENKLLHTNEASSSTSLLGLSARVSATVTHKYIYILGKLIG
jgi:hypothetical protein